jgi:acid stress-induced BolA-like protein IbaG/YrbA
MADQQLKIKIENVLKKGYFRDPNDLVDVSDGEDGENVHVVVVSRKFDGRRSREKQDLIWSELTSHLTPQEWGRVTLSIGVSPEEIKAS